MAAPTYVLYAEPLTNWSTTTTPKTTTSFNVQSGDLIILKAITTVTNSGSATNPTPSASGGSITWTLETSAYAAGEYRTGVWIWSGSVGATASGITISLAHPWSVSQNWGVAATLWRNHGGTGVVFSGTTGALEPPDITALCSANSAIDGLVGDWWESDGTSRAWLSINGTAITEELFEAVSGSYNAYVGYHTDVGSSGNKTYGLSAPNMRWSLTAVEVLAGSSGSQSVSCQVLAVPGSILNPIITPPPQSVSFNVINASTTVLDPGSEMILQLDVTNTTSTIFSPALDYNVELSVLNVPSNILQPLLMDNIDLQVLATNSSIFDPGLNQDINIPVLNAPESVLTPNVPAPGAQTIDFDIISDISELFAPTTFTTINTPVINVPGTVESPTVSYEVVVPVINTSSTLFTPSLEYLIEMQTVNTAPSIHAPRIGEEVAGGFSGAIVKGPDTSPFPIGIR